MTNQAPPPGRPKLRLPVPGTYRDRSPHMAAYHRSEATENQLPLCPETLSSGSVYQKDYVLFVIEQFARILRKILAKILGGDFAEAEFQIEQVYRQYLGLNSDLIDSFSHRYLMQLQRTDPEAYADRCIVLAEVLRLDALLFEKREQLGRAFVRGLKALNVLLELYAEEPQKAKGHVPTMQAWAKELEALLARAPVTETASLGFPEETIRRLKQLAQLGGTDSP